MTKINQELSESMNLVIIRPIYDEISHFIRHNNIHVNDTDGDELFNIMEDLKIQTDELFMDEKIKSILNASR